jgi:ribosome-binding protein aMBF1 (putative translation factor)
LSDLEKYITKREKKTPGFKKGVMEEYNNLMIGARIKELRTSKGITQEELAKKLKTTKSAVSRLENHAESVRLSTLEKVAEVLGKKLEVSFK